LKGEGDTSQLRCAIAGLARNSDADTEVGEEDTPKAAAMKS